MLLQTNSYVVPREKRAEHARLVRKFRQTLARLGCDQFDVFEQVGPNWGSGETTGRFVQMMRFRDRKHQVAVQTAEKQDPAAQALIQEFVELINFGYQQQQGLFAVGYYQSVLPVAPMRMLPVEGEENLPAEPEHTTGSTTTRAMPRPSTPKRKPPRDCRASARTASSDRTTSSWKSTFPTSPTPPPTNRIRPAGPHRHNPPVFARSAIAAAARFHKRLETVTAAGV